MLTKVWCPTRRYSRYQYLIWQLYEQKTHVQCNRNFLCKISLYNFIEFNKNAVRVSKVSRQSDIAIGLQYFIRRVSEKSTVIRVFVTISYTDALTGWDARLSSPRTIWDTSMMDFVGQLYLESIYNWKSKQKVAGSLWRLIKGLLTSLRGMLHRSFSQWKLTRVLRALPFDFVGDLIES